MIIDGHAARQFSDSDQLTKILDRLGVDKVVLCPSLKNNTDLPDPPFIRWKKPPSLFFLNRLTRLTYKFLLRDKGDGNAFVHSLFEKCPERIVQFYWLDPLEPDFMRKLENACNNWRIKGIKLHQACNPFRNDGPEMKEIAVFAGAKKLPVFIHLYSKKECFKLIQFAESQTETNFIVAHLAGLDIFVERALKLKNLYFDISAVDLNPIEETRHALEVFGEDRLIFGSDMPFGKLEKGMAKLRTMGLSVPEERKVLGENIAGILEL